MKRILLFLGTNLAVVLVLSVTLRILGVEPYLTEQGLNLGSLLIFAAELVLGILASIIVMWFSRQREFRADAGGARLAGRGKMIAALRRLAAVHAAPMPDKLTAFGIAGSGGGGLKRLFMTHPPLAERIAALQTAGTGRTA